MSNYQAYTVLEEASQKWPDLPAIHDEFGTMTFAELYAQAEDLKNELIQRGVKERTAVGVMARNSRNFIAAIFAVTGCGATVMPMSHQLKRSEIDQMIRDAELHFVMDDMTSIEAIPSEDIIALRQGKFRFSATGHRGPFALHVENPAFMRFTSGTTGKAKGVIISHQSAIERIDGANRELQLGPGDTVIWVLPIAYHFVVSILLYVKYGAAIAIVRDFLPGSIVESTNKYKGTLLYASPMQIRLLANSTEDAQLSSLRTVISTSAAISADVCETFQKKYAIPVSQAYGIIEIGLPIINAEKSAVHPEAVGYALPDYTVEILNDRHEPLAAGQIGHLAIKGPGMFDAYLQPPLTRSEVLVNGYFLTADFASKTEDGLIKVEGREKSVINVSGNKVFPEEVEGILEALPEIKQARITGVPHPLMGQIVQAEVILEQGQQIDIEELLTYCRKRLSTFKVPQRVLVVDKLPMTGSGKVRRY